MKITFGGYTATVGTLSSMAVLFCLPSMAFASTLLGSAQSFAVLGGQAVTNAGTTAISGSLGVYPGSAITGLTAANVSNGTLYTAADAVVGQAQNDERYAYNALALLPADFTLLNPELGGLTLTPGVYKFSSGAQLTGSLTLDFQNNTDAQFVFQIATTLKTGSASSVTVLHGTATDGIFWQVGSSATLGTTTSFAGNILALTSIVLETGAKIECGRAFAQTGAVTMQSNVISGNCSVNVSGPNDFGSGGFSPTSNLQIATPEPGTFLPFGISLGLGLVAFTLKYSARKK